MSEPSKPKTLSATAVFGRLTNLQLRIVSAVVLAIAVLALTWVGGLWFRLFAAVLGIAMFYEWMTMAKAWNRKSAAYAVLLLAVLAAIVSQVPAWSVLAMLLALLVAGRAYDQLVGNRPWPIAGLLYAGIAAFSLAYLRGGDIAGLKTMLFLFATVWATDILAYFVGRAVGGPKLAPSISPGKTWSGALGGAAGGVIAGLIVALAAKGAIVPLAISALVLSMVSQLGDLFESWVKRRHGAKDSSHLIPGHGGVMDRVDGLVAAAFALYLIGAILGHPNMPAHGLFPS